jgi:Ca2+-binding EF-hand superfamily protein
MRKGTKIALAASAIAIVGAAGLSSMASAEYRGSSGWGHHSGGNNSEGRGWGHHRRGRHGKGHKGWGMYGMMKRFDTNEDGKLTQEELDGARNKLLSDHDGDKDGKLTLAEFEKLWLEVKRQRMVRSFQRIDKDGDASITLDEFLKPYSRIVERMDRNDDGVLDLQDHRHHGWRGRGQRMMDGEHHRGGDGDDKDKRPHKGGGMGPRG